MIEESILEQFTLRIPKSDGQDRRPGSNRACCALSPLNDRRSSKEDDLSGIDASGIRAISRTPTSTEIGDERAQVFSVTLQTRAKFAGF
jgi:hypothetical protein